MNQSPVQQAVPNLDTTGSLLTVPPSNLISYPNLNA
jgi:hypothetical protein